MAALNDVTLILPTYHRHLPWLKELLPLYRQMYEWKDVYASLGDWPCPTPEMIDFFECNGLTYYPVDWDDLAFCGEIVRQQFLRQSDCVGARLCLPYYQGIRRCNTEYFFSIDTDCSPLSDERASGEHWVDRACRLLVESDRVVSVGFSDPYWISQSEGSCGGDSEFIYHSHFSSGCFLGRTKDFLAPPYDSFCEDPHHHAVKFEALFSAHLLASGKVSARMRKVTYDSEHFGSSGDEATGGPLDTDIKMDKLHSMLAPWRQNVTT